MVLGKVRLRSRGRGEKLNWIWEYLVRPPENGIFVPSRLPVPLGRVKSEWWC